VIVKRAHCTCTQHPLIDTSHNNACVHPSGTGAPGCWVVGCQLDALASVRPTVVSVRNLWVQDVLGNNQAADSWVFPDEGNQQHVIADADSTQTRRYVTHRPCHVHTILHVILFSHHSFPYPHPFHPLTTLHRVRSFNSNSWCAS
jgi:hypothetical protein